MSEPQELIMLDSGETIIFNIDCSELELGLLKREFDTGNDSVYSFMRLMDSKGYKYKIKQRYGRRITGFY